MKTEIKVKIHDGTVGALILSTVVLGITVDRQWLYAAGFVGALMISSVFTGFCPVYFILDRVLPAGAPGRAAG